MLSLADPAQTLAPSRFGRLAARVPPAGRRTMEEGRRLAKRAMARTRLMYAGALRRARTAATRAATVLGPWREPIIRGAACVGTGVQRLLGRIRRRHALIVAGSFAVLLALIVGYSIATLPLDGGLQVDPTPSALVVEADGGETFATRGVFKGTKVTAADVPAHLAQAVVSIEDRRFYSHHGVDPWGILRAAWRNWQAGGTREGGSTVTQQLARLMFLSPDQNLRRKIQEAVISLWLERQLSKEEILLRYLNTAYFGSGAYGVDAAARRYFAKATKELSLAEAAMLAGLVRAPSQLAPTRNLGGAKERADTVLQAMIDTGAISAEQAEAARSEPVNLRVPPETPPGTNYFVDTAAADVRRLLGGASGDLTLRSTLDLELQRLAEGVIERRLDDEGRQKNVSQAALVALSPDGAIRALVGGRDYEASQFNRATQARRQAGSLFKLFVYLAAMQKGYEPQSTVVDRPTQIGDWEPQNANGRFRGSVSLRNAFAQSINTVAAQLADEVGIPAVIETAKRLGVQSELPAVPSLALGSAEVTLLEMTRAYAAVATGNLALEPYTVRSIQGTTQQALFTRPGAAPRTEGLGGSRAAMLDLLQAVVREGTGKAARLPNVPAGGKTGTTQEYRDAWFIGFTPDLIVGVWVGNDDNAPMNKVVGGDLPAEIWRDFLTRAAPLLAKDKRQAPADKVANTDPESSAAPAAGANLVRGVPEVMDTGTLAIRGTIVRLEGIQGERGTLARQLARFLRRREVTCAPSDAPGVQRCRIGNYNLSAIILAAGGGRATPDASEELQAAEDQARSARLGVWRRGR
ncbi:penicillin-binding protein (plasmid) [Microvirga ossetica]|uniref:Penicillin-binding protein n=1 Tax=Microvirga ossetica TaxID=1882682 RepID=A0A1B2EVD5_9HYPH|nr:penicillin-binding protein [Microvirga ossetica]